MVNPMAMELMKQVKPDDSVAEMGALIRRTRSGRYTMQQLANKAGVSVGLISELERGQGNPSYLTLLRLASALDLRVGDLVRAGDSDPGIDRMLVRRDERKRLQVGEGGLVHQLLTPNLQGRLEMLRTEVPAGFSNEEAPFRHIGEECVHLLTGTLEVSVAGQLFQLKGGDSITYDSGEEHWWRNTSGKSAEVIGAVTPPSF